MGKKRSKEPKKAEIFQRLAQIINKGGRYKVTSPTDGIFNALTTISQDDPDIVKLVPREHLAAELVKYCISTFAKIPEMQLTANDADAAVDYWLYATPTVPAPRAFAWPGEVGLAYTRLPWPAVAGEIPTWERILGRMSNRQAFLAWVGSLFDEKSYEQQYVWIHGKGLEGKGSINRFLSRVFGPAYCTKQPKERGDKFWMYELLGKRLAVFSDCDDTRFVTSGLFKGMTGGDPQTVEGKYQKSYTVKLNAKYLLFSNERPSLSSDMADRRRIIYCEISPRGTDDPIDVDFEEKLWQEGGAFLGRCIDAYAPTVGRAIPTEEENITEWIETVEMHFSQTFDMHFSETASRDKWLTGEQLQRIIQHQFKSRKEQLEFISWLERVKKIKRQTVDNKTGEKKYKGLGVKPPVLLEEDFSWRGRQ